MSLSRRGLNVSIPHCSCIPPMPNLHLDAMLYVHSDLSTVGVWAVGCVRACERGGGGCGITGACFGCVVL